jgi:uncharacterized protein (DUF1800 family)
MQGFQQGLLMPAGKRRAARWLASTIATAGLLAGCGGGGGASETAAADAGASDRAGVLAARKTTESTVTPTRAEATRFLMQATFGPTEADIQRVMSSGYAAWLDNQFALPANPSYYSTRYKAEDAEAKAGTTRVRAGADTVYSSFYTRALTAPDQLRQRVSFALSQIMVVSALDVSAENSAAVASYTDMLNRNAFGSYRSLLQDAALHPAMGIYLSHLKNRKEDSRIGRVPDQNFAREVMQLFSIGLVKLRLDGAPRLDVNGKATETYTQSDIIGLSRVFTGWSWGGPDTTEPRFNGIPSARDPERLNMPMQPYPQWHSTLEKTFLGVTIPAQTTADPQASLKTALDTIANHPNVAPFIGRQLIQRLVTSTPSPAYVRRVANVFNNNGAGVRGDLKAVVRAVLLDSDARSTWAPKSDSFGKLKEPVLRLTSFLRTYAATSDSGRYLITRTDDPGLALAQTPLRSNSVFNFYRPGYVPAGTQSGAKSMTVPEMQITHEASVPGYVNYMSGVIDRGVGTKGWDNLGTRPDVQFSVQAELGVSTDSAALVDMVMGKLLPDQSAPALRTEIIAAVESLTLPKLKSDNSNLAWYQTVQRHRVNIALLLTLASHEYIIQR